MKARAAACALLLSSCGSMDWMADPSSPNSRSIATLTWVASIGIAVMVLIVWGIIVYLIARRERGTLAEHMPHTTKSGMGWIYVWGLAVPGVLFAAALIASIVMMYAASEHQHAHRKPDIIVTGHQWWWEVRYSGAETFTTANEIHIPVGRPVIVGLRSADVIHSFWVPKLHGKVDLIPGQTNYVRVEADRAGTFQGECAEFCGEQHAHMRLMVVAQQPDEYQRWLSQMRADAVEPTDPVAKHGQDVFLSQACALCHTIRGTLAQGVTGPDLTHIGSHHTLAGGELPNTPGNLAAWVTSAQNLKPGVKMPNISTLDGQDLRALVTYLESLK